MSKHLYIAACVMGILTTSSQVHAKGVAPMPCVSGSPEQKAKLAQEIVLDTLKDNLDLAMLGENAVVIKGLALDQQKQFYSALGKEMASNRCFFDKNAVLDTPAHILESIQNHAYQPAFSKMAPSWLRPGFKAVLSGYDSNNTIFIETTDLGFIFHACEKAPPDDPEAVPPNPSRLCPTLGNSAIYVPVDTMLAQANGIQRGVLLALRILANISLIVTSNLSLSLVTPAAQTIMSFTDSQKSVDAMKQNWRVHDETQQVMHMGNLTAAGTKDQIVTRLFLKTSYEKLKQGLLDILYEAGKAADKGLKGIEMHPNDPNNQQNYGLIEERRFRAAQIKAEAKGEEEEAAAAAKEAAETQGSFVPDAPDTAKNKK